MDQQLIALIDLLGFSSIVEAQDAARQEDILSLLTAFANARGDSGKEIRNINGTTKEISVQPAISAFSDHIVFSFTSNQLEQYGFTPVFELANNSAWIFCRAIRFGCLVRGGIAYGDLHHRGGVVFGKALNEAHTLESKFAKWPRIIISASAAQKIGRHCYLKPTYDGFLSLDYLRAAYDLEMTKTVASPPLAARALATRNWINGIRKLCEGQISVLTQTENVPGLQNWRWFLRQFECFVAGLHPSITGDEAGPA